MPSTSTKHSKLFFKEWQQNICWNFTLLSGWKQLYFVPEPCHLAFILFRPSEVKCYCLLSVSHFQMGSFSPGYNFFPNHLFFFCFRSNPMPLADFPKAFMFINISFVKYASAQDLISKKLSFCVTFFYQFKRFCLFCDSFISKLFWNNIQNICLFVYFVRQI